MFLCNLVQLILARLFVNEKNFLNCDLQLKSRLDITIIQSIAATCKGRLQHPKRLRMR